jgi:hypothetical protein
MVDERRKSPRIEAQSAALQINNQLDGSELGTVANLSIGGLLLISNRELFQDGVLQLSILALQHEHISGGEIPIGVRVLWSAPARSPNQHWAGLEIIDIGPDARSDLARLLDHLQQQSG